MSMSSCGRTETIWRHALAESAVLDAAVVVRATFPGPGRVAYRQLLERLLLAEVRFEAPALWTYETTSAVTKAVYFGLLSPEDGQGALQQFRELGVRLHGPDAEDDRRAFAWTLRLQRAAAYDSYYLALAERLGCDLWTTDDRLVRAVNLPWVRSAGSIVE